MTLSPSHCTDEWGCLSPTAVPKFDSDALGTCERQTPRNNQEIRKYCENRGYQYVLCKRPVYSTSRDTISRSPVTLHTRYVILTLSPQNDSIKIQSLVAYRDVMVCLTLTTNTGEVFPLMFFVQPNNMACITIDRDFATMQVQFRRTQEPHSPQFTDLFPLFERMDVGMMLWFLRVHKSQVLAFYQSKKTGDLYCCSKGCKKKFRTVDEWKNHFGTTTITPGRFSMAVLQHGNITHHPTATLKIRKEDAVIEEDNPKAIKEKLKLHSWAWKSLSDTIHGKHMTKNLEHKLNTIVKRRRIE